MSVRPDGPPSTAVPITRWSPRNLRSMKIMPASPTPHSWYDSARRALLVQAICGRLKNTAAIEIATVHVERYRRAIVLCVREHVVVRRRDESASRSNASRKRLANGRHPEAIALGVHVVLRDGHFALDHTLDTPETAVVVDWRPLSRPPRHHHRREAIRPDPDGAGAGRRCPSA